MDIRLWRLVTVGLVIVGGLTSPAASAPVPGPAPSSALGTPVPVQTPEAETGPLPMGGEEIAMLLGDAALDVRSVHVEGGEVTVCVDLMAEELAAGDWQGVESVNEAVRRAISDVAWTTLYVQAWDDEQGSCRELSTFAPEAIAPTSPAEELPLPDAIGGKAATSAEFPRGLYGKTVYVSAGHGWFFNGTTWRTQRPVYEGFIEDHNNAEAVTQYLIPYLENAGATVIPVRERDWNRSAVIADNDQGLPTYTETGPWYTGAHGVGGYAGGTYRYANAQPGAATATAVWRLSVPAPGDYAVYAWVYPGSNRVRDARYTVSHAGGSTEVVLDQRIMPQTWRYLGTFPFHVGTATVMVDNRTSYEGGVVVADAIRLGGGTFDSLAGISRLAPATSYAPSTPPSTAPQKPWWESSAFYWAQVMGLAPDGWPYFNDVVGRPIFARWHQRVAGSDAINDAVYISWHTNGYRGTTRGTESYIHNGATYPVTPGSAALQAAVHDELIRDIRAGWDASWLDRGKKRADLGELRMLWDPDYPHARIPGVLLEIAFHDNPEDGNALKEPLFNQLAARAVYQGIVKYFDAQDAQFGGRELAPEPPTALRVQNTGAGSVRVAWAPSPTDAVGLRGAAATGYRVYTSPDGFAWGQPVSVAGTSLTISNLAPGQTLYVRVTGTNAGGESMPSEVLGARVGEARLLLVNAFDELSRSGLVVENDPVEKVNLRMWLDQMNSRSYVVHHGQAVPIAYAWDSASNEAVSGGHVGLTAYGVVNWILGEETSAALNQTERTLLRAYLAANRGLLISGSDYAWQLEAQGRDPDFLHNYLYTDYLAYDAGTYTARPSGTGVFAGLPDLHFDAPGEFDVDRPDVLAPFPGSGAQVALTYVGGTGGAAAIQHAVPVAGGLSCRRVLALGFPFESLRPAERAAVMARALNFLDCVVNTTILSPENGKYYRSTPPLQGSASGTNVTGVELQLQRKDGLYWTETGWSPVAGWFSSQPPPEAWSYWRPLDETTYTLRARAVGPAVIDETPAQVTFGLDLTPPAAVSVIAPTGGPTLTGPLVNLVWTALPPDGGSPLHYEVELDGRVHTAVPGTPYVVVPGPGVHSWRVRATDAAGNAIHWSLIPFHSFEVEVEQLFLPLLLRN
jgi:N-acetylmuramoyl-L-alanine amidase